MQIVHVEHEEREEFVYVGGAVQDSDVVSETLQDLKTLKKKNGAN